ncbi:MAG: TauD/TfdA family dioxygenase [Streptomyces sp.]|uniref:TauD/TfdA family dioxygenase n=1 Tax=Streptomyces sp. TaxID=1931 RepID=UPI0025FBDFA7|nr:TauD/TfdA family dioxygenase [Streptomyces sp.]MBW8800925.1 TauD/TfdA family dioxygenase [Streptomyces sp.]
MSHMLQWQVVEGTPAITQVAGLTGMTQVRAWLEDVRPQLTAALRKYGAIYLRGLPMATIDDFAQIRDVLISERTPYREKTTPRSRLGDDVFSSTDLPAAQSIRMHNENSYTLTFPGRLLFGCLIAPSQGGATPVADCRKVLDALPDQVVEKIRTAGWRLSRSYSEHISTDWQTAFATDDVDEVARYCADNLIGHQWYDDGTLKTSQIRPGIITHPSSGEEVWFNHLLFWNEWALEEDLREALVDEFGRDGLPFNTEFGDGAALSNEDLQAIQAAYDAATVRETWQPGDVMLVDNILTAHGRDPFRGDRKIVVAMGDPVELSECRPTVEPSPAFA